MVPVSAFASKVKPVAQIGGRRLQPPLERNESPFRPLLRRRATLCLPPDRQRSARSSDAEAWQRRPDASCAGTSVDPNGRPRLGHRAFGGAAAAVEIPRRLDRGRRAIAKVALAGSNCVNAR